MELKGIANKKQMNVKIYEFKGKTNLRTLEGWAYDIDGKLFYIVEGPKGERWPIRKDIFNDTYEFVIEKD